MNEYGSKASDLALLWVADGRATMHTDINGNLMIRFSGFGKYRFLSSLKK